MINRIPPRLRAPFRVLAVGVVIIAVAIATHGWGPPVYLVLVPFVLLVAGGYYVWGAQDSDSAAMIRREPDERQAYRQLKVQALVGKVMSLASAVAYLVAVGLKASFWPFGIALALPVLTALVGWRLYRDRGQGGDDDSAARHV
jgi:MFS family permease